MTPTPLHLALIGAGGIGSAHLTRLRDMNGVRVAAICDIDLDKARKAAMPDKAAVYEDWRAMIERETLDAVLVCTPTFARGEEVRAAAERGLAVFVEKPAAPDLALAQENVEIFHSYRTINAIGYMWRYAEAFLECKKRIGNRAVGLVQGTATYPLPGGLWFWDRAKSGGQIFDQTTHLLNVAEALVGPADSVFAVGTQKQVVKEEWVKTEDVSSMSVKYRSGAVGSFANTWYCKQVNFTLSFFGADFGLKVDFMKNELTGTIDDAEVAFRGTMNPYAVELERFVEAVRTRDQSRILSPYADGVNTLRLTLAANRSLDSGRPETV